MQQSNGSISSQPSEQQNKQRQPPTVTVAQQWVPMQYPTMILAPHLIPPPQPYAPPPLVYNNYRPMPHLTPQYHHHQQHVSNGDNSENKTLWIGDLCGWMDENFLHGCFASTGEISSIKVIRNKHSGVSEGYGFVEFHSHAIAEKVLQDYPGVLMPNTDQPFRLNWATFSTGEKGSDNITDLSIFVGDLAADVTDTMLHETFANAYPSVKAAKVVFDANTGRSKGYGFVRFGDDNERTQAMTQMNGVYCSSRPMRIGAATPRKSSGHQGGQSNGTSSQSEADSTNTTIFVGGLDPNVTDEDLRQQFSQYGEIVSVKIPVGKGCGFVQFANRNDAEEALQKLNGTMIGKQTVRLSWGRNPKQFRIEFGNHGRSSGPTYAPPVYDGYGYAFTSPNDPMFIGAAYGTYPVYGGGYQQQVS